MNSDNQKTESNQKTEEIQETGEKQKTKETPKLAEHTTRDIYLAAFGVVENCPISLKTTVGETHVVFVITAEAEKMKALVSGYFEGTASCSPKALKFAITDLKNQMFSVLDARKGQM